MTDALEAAKQFVDAFNSHDDRRIRQAYADNVVFEAPGGVRLEGPDAATAFAMSFIRAFPDVRLTLKNLFESDGWVAYEAEFEGTHEDTLEGTGGDIPATHRRATGRAAEILRIEDGKVTEERLYFDQLELLTQLGVIEQPQEAGALT
ncbi:MAG: ester cyclase [Actinomycetota bacterium]|nr:ester cyclase [Actinomycetota bacterium]